MTSLTDWWFSFKSTCLEMERERYKEMEKLRNKKRHIHISRCKRQFLNKERILITYDFNSYRYRKYKDLCFTFRKDPAHNTGYKKHRRGSCFRSFRFKHKLILFHNKNVMRDINSEVNQLDINFHCPYKDLVRKKMHFKYTNWDDLPYKFVRKSWKYKKISKQYLRKFKKHESGVYIKDYNFRFDLIGDEWLNDMIDKYVTKS